MWDQLKRVLVERYIGAITIGLLVLNAFAIGTLTVVWVLGMAVKDIFIVNSFYLPSEWMATLRIDFYSWGFVALVVFSPLIRAVPYAIAAMILYRWLYGGRNKQAQ